MAYLAGVILPESPETHRAADQAFIAIVEVYDSARVPAFLAVQSRGIAQYATVMTSRTFKTREYLIVACWTVRHTGVHISHFVIWHGCVVDPASRAGIVASAKTKRAPALASNTVLGDCFVRPVGVGAHEQTLVGGHVVIVVDGAAVRLYAVA